MKWVCRKCGIESDEELLEHGVIVTNLIQSKIKRCKGKMKKVK